MSPRTTAHYRGYGTAINPVLFSEFAEPHSATMLGAYFKDSLVGESSERIGLPVSFHGFLSAALNHISAILRWSSFDKVSGVEALPIIASVPCLRFWPMAIGDEERDPVHAQGFTATLIAHANEAISGIINKIWPVQTLVGFTIENLLSKPFIALCFGWHGCMTIINNWPGPSSVRET